MALEKYLEIKVYYRNGEKERRVLPITEKQKINDFIQQLGYEEKVENLELLKSFSGRDFRKKNKHIKDVVVTEMAKDTDTGQTYILLETFGWETCHDTIRKLHRRIQHITDVHDTEGF